MEKANPLSKGLVAIEDSKGLPDLDTISKDSSFREDKVMDI